MRKNLLKKVLGLFVMCFILLTICNNDVKAAESVDNKDKETIPYEELDKENNIEEKIMKYDSRTGKTTEVDMKELESRLISKYGKLPTSTQSFYPLEYKSTFTQNMNKKQSMLTLASPITVGGYTAYPVSNVHNYPAYLVCRTISSNGHGSAALVAPSVCLTAAHCIMDGSGNHYQNWKCFPEFENENGTTINPSYGWSEIYYSNLYFINPSSPNNDWCICILQGDTGPYYLGTQIYANTSQLVNVGVTMRGYPAESTLGFNALGYTQYTSAGTIQNAYNYYFKFPGVFAKGFSGGPVTRNSDTKIIGIATGRDNYNLGNGTRITQQIVNIILDHQ